MEFEIDDDPQGLEEGAEAARDGGIVEDHIALRNQSSVKPRDYSGEYRRDSYLITPSQPE